MITLKPKQTYGNVGQDIIALTLGFCMLAFYFLDYRFTKMEWFIVSVFVALWLLIYFWRKLHYSNRDTEFRQIIFHHLVAYFGFIAIILLFYILYPIPVFHKKRVLAFIIGFPVLAVTLNLLFDSLKAWVISRSQRVKYTLVAGTGNVAQKVKKQLYGQRVSGYKIKGFINCLHDEECLVGQENVVGNLTTIREYLMENPVDEIVIALPGKHPKKVQNIVETADYFGIRVKYIPDYHEMFDSHYKHIRIGEIDALNLRQLPTDEKYNAAVKRVFDLLFSTLILIALAPLFLVIAALIKLSSPGPVFYCPIRVGRSGQPFKVYKFRSMRESDAASSGTLSTQKDDPRITRLGKVLRKYSLDELPQFINVFLGEMSVVGPRPHRRFLDKQLQENVYRYMVRHYVKPGITGWAQVNGWRGPTDTDEQRRQRTLHDLWYLDNWSLWLDIKIIFLTVFSSKAHRTAFSWIGLLLLQVDLLRPIVDASGPMADAA